MANDLGANPWIIDTPGAGVLFTHHIDVRHMEFSLYTSEFSQCIVTDQNGHVVWSATGAADLTEVKGFTVGWINGLIVPTLQNSGILRIYIK